MRIRRILLTLALCMMLAGLLAAPASAAFQDVPAGHWADESIQRCVEQGFFNGQSETRFGLGQEMSRGAFAVVLCRFFDWELSTSAGQTYSDVSADAWYADAVRTAYEHGAVTDQRTVFRPEAPITREELAVMLLRALGYGSLAGLAQDLPTPFQDLTTNAGYLTMISDMGLMGGTSETEFSPSGTAAREQVAVILMRLYDQLYSRQPEKLGIVSAVSDLTGLDIAAVPATRLYSMAVKETMSPETVADIRAEASSAGAEVFLYLKGSETALGQDPGELADAIVESAQAYDGLLLELSKVTGQKRLALTRLVQAVENRLDGKPFYLVVEAPTRSGKLYDGYQYEKLAAATDQLILRISGVQEVTDTFVTAPIDPLEEVYYALATVGGQVGADQLGLMLDSELSCWVGDRSSGISETELAALLADNATRVYESDRYACAYLTAVDEDERPLTVWFLTRQDVETRVHLAVSLGVERVCVSDWDAATEAFRTGLVG